MLDRALIELGRKPTARACEVPEVKHACLGGMYALKGAARWAALEGRGKKAIVVAADIAEYERGSTGEPTQGAGAVAMLVERDPRPVRDRSAALRQRSGLSRRRLPQAVRAPLHRRLRRRHASRARLPRVQRQVLHDLLRGRGHRRARRHVRAHRLEPPHVLGRGRSDHAASAVSPHADPGDGGRDRGGHGARARGSRGIRRPVPRSGCRSGARARRGVGDRGSVRPRAA